MIDLIKEPNRLKVVLDKPASEYEDEFKSLFSLTADNAFCELFEYDGYWGNGWDNLTGRVALTEAPIISDDCDFDDNGEIADCGIVYFYADYMVKDPVWELLINGYFYMEKA